MLAASVVFGATGLIFVDFINVYVIYLDGIDAEEWNGESQPWMIA